MASLLSCPAELRQQILSHCLPHEVHNAGVAPRTAPLLPLLLTSRVIRLDVLELVRSSWSPLYHIEDPHAFFITTLRRRNRRRLYADEDDELLHMRRISLRLFAGLDLKLMRNMAPMGAVDDDIFDEGAWLRCVGLLPSGPGAAVQSVVVDLTPAPTWMTLRRPNWVRATVLDARNKVFLRECANGVRRLVGALEELYGGTEVSILLGGVVLQKARRIVEDMTVVSAGRRAGTVMFAGEWLSGPVEVLTRLSLGLLCRCWGIDVGSPAQRNWSWESRMIQIRNERSPWVRKEGLTTPELDFKALGQVFWSKNSCTAYYVNAEADEKRTREELVRLLAFAVEVRTEGVLPDAAVDFEPAIRARRFLLHCLAKDLGLASVSVGDAGEKFVRVSRLAEASINQRESLKGGGDDEDDREHGEEDLSPSSIRAMELRRIFRGPCA